MRPFQQRFSRLVIAALTGAVLAACGNIYDRHDFESAVMNKSADEIQTKLGKPGAIEETDAQHVTWVYSGTTFDTANQNRRDSKAMVIFEHKGPGGALVATGVKFAS